MTTHTKFSTRVSLALAVCCFLALYGAIIANGRSSGKAAEATPRVSATMDISALMSDVDVVKLPLKEELDTKMASHAAR
jgi:hypothetical protein